MRPSSACDYFQVALSNSGSWVGCRRLSACRHVPCALCPVQCGPRARGVRCVHTRHSRWLAGAIATWPSWSAISVSAIGIWHHRSSSVAHRPCPMRAHAGLVGGCMAYRGRRLLNKTSRSPRVASCHMPLPQAKSHHVSVADTRTWVLEEEKSKAQLILVTDPRIDGENRVHECFLVELPGVAKIALLELTE